ncbi:hypothetical protein LNP25_21625 [Klebsiella variicola subsp. variicola]|nr:hypothetical protein [Klebsiella variicola subsp. variicola]
MSDGLLRRETSSAPSKLRKKWELTSQLNACAAMAHQKPIAPGASALDNTDWIIDGALE